MDLIGNIWNTSAALIDMLPMSTYSFLLRSNIMLILAALFAEVGFNKGYRKKSSQLFLAVLGLVVGMSCPLEPLLYTRVFQVIKPWFLILLTVGAFIVLPGRTAQLLEPRLGSQLRLRKRITITLSILFILNCLGA